MTRVLQFQSDARREYVEIARGLEQCRPGLGGEFRLLFQTKVRRLIHWPRIGKLIKRRLRRIYLKRFRHYVFYQIFPDVIRIVAIVHSARSPKAWKRILKSR